MTCYACSAPATATCARCGRSYCPEHGGDICAHCADPASGTPSSAWYRGSVLALVVGSAVGIWMLVAPPGLTGSSGRAPSGTIGGPPENIAPTAEATAAPGAQPASQPARTYTVQPGDTLAEIAARFDTTVDAIAQANGIEPNLIRPGQELKIPR